MKPAKSHIIQSQSIEIEFENLDDAFGVQNQIAEVFYEKLQPRMEVLFDELFGKNYYASIDKLEIDCGLLNQKNWEQEFTEQAIRKLKEELVQVNKKEVDLKKIEETTAAETFFFFLENGFLPWNKRIDSIAGLEQLLSVNEKLIAQLKELIEQKEKTAERLVVQFSKKFIAKIINAITQGKNNELDKIYSLIEKLNPVQINKQIDKHITDVGILKVFAVNENRNRVQEFFNFLLSKVEMNLELKSEIRAVIKSLEINESKSNIKTEAVKNQTKIKENENQESNSELKNKNEKGEKRDKEENEKPHSAIYINNAGLVLLHPFLQTLFEHLKFAEENKWIDEASQYKAVLVLEFLATGNDEFEEFNLMLNKILCGIDLDEIVATERQLDDEIKNECEDLLSSLIKHWSALRNTSTAGLRETFIQRNGKLSKVDNGWLLHVEQKSFDILLSSLPWGIGTIKLPWMKEILYVEW